MRTFLFVATFLFSTLAAEVADCDLAPPDNYPSSRGLLDAPRGMPYGPPEGEIDADTGPGERFPSPPSVTPGSARPPQATPQTAEKIEKPPVDVPKEGYTVNFDDIPVVQLIRFITQISDINFVFDSKDLQNIRITIISEEPTTVKDLMASLLQVLRMNNLSVLEQGNNVIIYKEPGQAKVATVITEDNLADADNAPIVTRVFRLYNVAPDRLTKIIKPLLSKDAIVEESNETRHIVVSDITANVDKISDLINALDAPNMLMDIAEYQVQSAYPSVLVSFAKEILAPLTQDNPVQLIAQPSARKIFIISTPHLIGKAKQILASLDLPEITEVADLPPTEVAGNAFHVYKLKYRNGQEIAQAIHEIGTNLRYMSSASVDLISTIFSIQWIEVNNSIVISGTQAAVDKVIELINDLDTAPKQVYIEVLIIDTTLSNSLNFGVEWIALANEQSKLAFASGLLDVPPEAAPTGSLGIKQPPLYGGARSALNSPPPNAARGGAPGTGGDVPLTSGFGLGIVGNIIRHNGTSFLTMGALLKALEIDSDTKIVLNPKIMAQDTWEANFFVGQNIPYQTTSTIVRDTGSVTQNIQYEDIGVQLRVTPQVGPDNIVTLLIDQAVSEVISSTAVIQTGIDNSTMSLLAPTTEKILATTRVHVPDGCFLVMSGHIREEVIVSRRGIPCLGTLPLIGPAFSNTLESRTKRNLLMFIRPHVVTSVGDGSDLTNREGYKYNFESDPASLDVIGPARAPDDESCGLGEAGYEGGCVMPGGPLPPPSLHCPAPMETYDYLPKDAIPIMPPQNYLPPQCLPAESIPDFVPQELNQGYESLPPTNLPPEYIPEPYPQEYLPQDYLPPGYLPQNAPEQLSAPLPEMLPPGY